MSSLRALGASFAFGDGAELFSSLDFHLVPGWTGLVGANGAGKSTLLQLLRGELRPSGGAFALEPEGARVVLCPQRVDDLSPEVVAFSQSWEGSARRLHGQLRLSADSLDRWETLSPGERKRWQVGAALAGEPEVLLLDEPTNHLDAQARELLLSALGRYRGIGLVVSHDREVLDRLTTSTLRLHRGEGVLYPGPWSEARVLWESERARYLEDHARAKEARDKADRQLREERRRLEATAAERSTGRRMKDKNDSDARTLVANYRTERAEKHLGRKVSALRHASEAHARNESPFEVDKELGRSVFVGWTAPHRPVLAQLDLPGLTAGGARLSGPVRASFSREDRVALTGPNGAGKSTLVAALLERLQLPPERVLYLPQEVRLEEGAAALEALEELPPDLRGRVLSLVAALGVDPDRLLASPTPSPGEVRKLLIAQGLANHVQAVVLDEPTNHLDLPSIERLEAALAAYPGALLVVSHDEAFLRACTRTRWHLGGARTNENAEAEASAFAVLPSWEG